MSRIQTDHHTHSALATMQTSSRAINKLTEQMATGLAMHSAADNAARLSIGNVMSAQYQGIMKASSNLHDGISLAQTAEAALNTITDLLQRMRELAVQAATGTLTDSDRTALDAEYQTHKQQIWDTVQNTEWNTHRLFYELAPNQFELQAGPNAGERIAITIPPVYADGELLGFTNGDFESGSVGDIAVAGWNITNARVTLDGQSTIAGWPTPQDTSLPASSPGDTVALTGAGHFSSQLVASDGAGRGGKSLRLESSGLQVGTGFGVTHGPYIVSDSTVSLKAGESVSFDWKAEGGEDAYDVYAYLLEVNTGNTVKLLDATGSSSSWATVTQTVPTAGEYKFVFVSGSYDQSGGRALGARLFIDNVVAPPKAMPTLNQTAIRTVAGAGLSISEVHLNMVSVNNVRASLGASMNRIQFAADHLAQYASDVANSRSQMIDTDYAEASAQLSRAQALQAGASMSLRVSRENAQSALNMVRSNDQLFEP